MPGEREHTRVRLGEATCVASLYVFECHEGFAQATEVARYRRKVCMRSERVTSFAFFCEGSALSAVSKMPDNARTIYAAGQIKRWYTVPSRDFAD